MDKVTSKKEDRKNREQLESQAGKRRFPYVKVIIALIALGGVGYPLLRYVFGVLRTHKDYYADYFYHWRINYADSPMITEVFREIRENAYSKQKHPDIKRYVEIAMCVHDKKSPDWKKGLLNMKFTEHFPRGDLHYHTHTNGMGFKFNEYFLEFRKRVIEEIMGVEKAYDKPNETKHFVLPDNKRVNTFDVVKILNRDDVSNDIRDFVKTFSVLIHGLVKGNINVYDDKGEISNVFYGYVDTLVNICKRHVCKVGDPKNDKVSNFKLDKKVVKDYIERNGKVTVSIYDTFMYSRGFYIFLLCTLGADLQGLDLDKKDDRKYRSYTIARLYAKIFTYCFPKGLGTKGKKKLNFLDRFFGKGIKQEYKKSIIAKKTETHRKYEDDNFRALVEKFHEVGQGVRASAASATT